MAKSIKARAKQALAFVRQLEADGKNWVQAQNEMYGVGGKSLDLFPTTDDRTAFSKTDEFTEIGKIFDRLPQPPAQREIRQPDEVSGKLTLRMPKSMHAALIAEATSEGISINQLILSKLSVQLRSVV